MIYYIFQNLIAGNVHLLPKMKETEEIFQKIQSPNEKVEYSVTSGHKPLSIIIKRNVTPLSKSKSLKKSNSLKKRKSSAENIQQQCSPLNGHLSPIVEQEFNSNDIYSKNNSSSSISSNIPLELITPSKEIYKKQNVDNLNNLNCFSHDILNNESVLETEDRQKSHPLPPPSQLPLIDPFSYNSPEDSSFSHLKLLDSAFLSDNSMCDLPLSFGDLLQSSNLYSFTKSSLESVPMLLANNSDIFCDQKTLNSHKPSNHLGTTNAPLFNTETPEQKTIKNEDQSCDLFPLNLNAKEILPKKQTHSLESENENFEKQSSSFLDSKNYLLNSNALSDSENLQESLLTLHPNKEELNFSLVLPLLNKHSVSDEHKKTQDQSSSTTHFDTLTKLTDNRTTTCNAIFSTALPSANSASFENKNNEENIPKIDSSCLNEHEDASCPSPLLFSDEEEEEEELPETFEKLISLEKQRAADLNELLKGLPPPSSLTKPQIDSARMLELYHENKHLYFSEKSLINKDELPLKENVLRSKTTLEQVQSTSWPEIRACRYFDIQYNNCLASEQFEALCLRLQERYVGAETASSCNALFQLSSLGDSAKKRAERRKRCNGSPGRRLSHLARRRQIFSRENILSSQNNANKTKLLVAVKREKPEKTKGSSSKKKNNKSISLKETTRAPPKRALFQSPTSPQNNHKDVDKQKLESTSRDLFGGGKRKREESSTPPAKRPNLETEMSTTKPPTLELSSTHQKKLLWAVAESLRKKGITMSHPNFRNWASRLARLCRREWLTAATARPGLTKQGSTSEKMLALANCHLESVLKFPSRPTCTQTIP